MAAPDRQRLECGCILEAIDDTLVLTACSAECWVVAYVQAESARQGKPTSVLDMRGTD